MLVGVGRCRYVADFTKIVIKHEPFPFFCFHLYNAVLPQ